MLDRFFGAAAADAALRPRHESEGRCASRNAGWTAPHGIGCAKLGRLEPPATDPVPMQRITIGLDIAKIGVLGSRRGYKRQDSCAEAAAPIAAPAVFCRLEPALIGIEACGSAHYWARELSALGHEVAADPVGICEAVRSAQQERRPRCGGGVHGGRPSGHAVCRDQERSETSLARARAVARIAAQAAHPADEQRARPAGRIQHHRGVRAARLCPAG